MSSPADEVASAVALLRSAPRGGELLQRLSSASLELGEALFQAIEGTLDERSPFFSLATPLVRHESVKMAIVLLGKKGVVEILEKNLLLLLGRIVPYVRSLDAMSLDEKVAWGIQGLSMAAKYIEEWHISLEERTRYIHDKKERRARRHLLQRTTRKLLVPSHPHPCSRACARLLSIVVPDGAASLYLPQGGSFFLPRLQELLDTSLPHVGLWLEEHGLRRDVKIDCLYWLYSMVYELMTDQSPPSKAGPKLTTLSALTQRLQPCLLPLFRAFMPSLCTLGSQLRTEVIAWKAVELLGRALGNVSLESLLINTLLRYSNVANMSLSHHDERGLDTLIDTMAGDERIIRGIIHSVVPQPNLPLADKANAVSVFFNLVLYGLKASASEIMTQGALSAFQWKEIQQEVLERFRWFALSPHCDQLVLEIVGSV